MSATLDHANIIPVYRVSQGGKLFWYVMKFLDGEPLDRILQRERQVAIDRCVDIVRQTAEALDYAHQNQVIHRDVKPANIIVDGRGRIVVTDFGIAKALDANTLTATGSMIGTPYFMSPEQCSGMRVGPSSDQYSLAVMTYLMLGGQLPFTGDSTFEIVRKHVMEPVPPLTALRPKLAKAVVAVVERGLAKIADERFTSCSEFAAALAAASLVAASPTVATEASGGPSAPPLVPPARPPRISDTVRVNRVPEPPRRSVAGTTTPRRTPILRAAAIVGLGAVGAALLLVWPSTPTDSRPSGPPRQSSQADGAPAVSQAAPSQSLPTSQGASPGVSKATSDPVQPSASGADPVPVSTPPSGATLRDAGKTASPAVTPKPPSPEQRRASLPTSRQPSRPADSTASAKQPSSPASAPASSVAPAPARITVGSTPSSAMSINGRAVLTNPVRNHEVPAGTVTIVFTVTDSTGVWTVTREFQAAAGESKNLGRIALTRP